jgi:hypothetical protein
LLFFGFNIADTGKFRAHLIESLRRLALQPGRLWRGPLLALLRVTTFWRRRGARGEGGGGSSCFDRLLARLDFGGVARAGADDAPAERPFDPRRMHPIGQIACGELGEGARKRRFTVNLRASLPTTDATQRLIDG